MQYRYYCIMLFSMILTISLFGRKSLEPSRDTQGLMYLSCRVYVSKNMERINKKGIREEIFQFFEKLL